MVVIVIIIIVVGFVFAVFVGGGVVEVLEEAGEVFGGGESHELGEVLDSELRAVGQDSGGAAHLFLVDVVAEFAAVLGSEYPCQMGAVDLEVAGDGLDVEPSELFIFATQYVLDNFFRQVVVHRSSGRLPAPCLLKIVLFLFCIGKPLSPFWSLSHPKSRANR